MRIKADTTSAINTVPRLSTIPPDRRRIEHIRPSARLPIHRRPNYRLSKRTERIQPDRLYMLDDIGSDSWISNDEE
jgi:hypothetical protein